MYSYRRSFERYHVKILELQCVYTAYTAWSGHGTRGLGIDGAITLLVTTKTNTTDCRLGIKCRLRVNADCRSWQTFKYIVNNYPLEYVILLSRSEAQLKPRPSNFTVNAIPTSWVNVFNRTSHTSPLIESNLRFLLDAFISLMHLTLIPVRNVHQTKKYICFSNR